MASQDTGPSAEFTKGKQKKVIVDKNGNRTSRWVSIDGADTPDADKFSEHLKDKSVLVKDKSDDAPAPFEKKNMTVQSVAAARALSKRLEEDPDAIFDEGVRAQASDGLTLMSSKKNGEDAYRAMLRDEIIAEFTDEEIRDKIEMEGEKGGIWAFVEERTMRFNPDLVELANDKRNLYTEGRVDSATMKEKFPETYDSIAECTGGAYVVPDHDSEAYESLKEDYRSSAERASVKRMGGDFDEASVHDLIDEYRRAERRRQETDDDYQRLRSAVTEACAPEAQGFKGNHPRAAQNYFDERLGGSQHGSAATGTTFSVAANVTHNKDAFVVEREAYHAGRMEADKAARQAKRDLGRCKKDKISAAKMKKSKDPEVQEQYKGARRVVRDLYTRTRKDGK